MKKLILPLLFIFLAAAAFGQTKKEMPKKESDLFVVVNVDHYKMSAEKMKKLKAQPAFSSYVIFGPKGIKPKAGYEFYNKGNNAAGTRVADLEADAAKDTELPSKGVLIICKKGNNPSWLGDKVWRSNVTGGKPYFDKYTWKKVGTEKPRKSVLSRTVAFAYDSETGLGYILQAKQECVGTPGCDCMLDDGHSGGHDCRPQEDKNDLKN